MYSNNGFGPAVIISADMSITLKQIAKSCAIHRLNFIEKSNASCFESNYYGRPSILVSDDVASILYTQLMAILWINPYQKLKLVIRNQP